MDKYIRMLLMQLSRRYKVTINTTMFCDEETGGVKSVIKLRIGEKGKRPALHESTHRVKRELVMEMVKWASPQSQ